MPNPRPVDIKRRNIGDMGRAASTFGGAVAFSGLLAMVVSVRQTWWAFEHIARLGLLGGGGAGFSIEIATGVFAGLTAIAAGRGFRIRFYVWWWFSFLVGIPIFSNWLHSVYDPTLTPYVPGSCLTICQHVEFDVAGFGVDTWVTNNLGAIRLVLSCIVPAAGALGLHAYSFRRRHAIGQDSPVVETATRAKPADQVSQESRITLGVAVAGARAFVRTSVVPVSSALLFLLLLVPTAGGYYSFAALRHADLRLAVVLTAVAGIVLTVLALRARRAILAGLRTRVARSAPTGSAGQELPAERPEDPPLPPPIRPSQSATPPRGAASTDPVYQWYAAILDRSEPEPDGAAIVEETVRLGGTRVTDSQARKRRHGFRDRYAREHGGARPWDRARDGTPPSRAPSDGARDGENVISLSARAADPG